MSPDDAHMICGDSIPQNPTHTRSALHAIAGLDLDPQIRAKLASRRSIVTRVHAERRFADNFSRHQYIEFG
jgi:hypothetical protein